MRRVWSEVLAAAKRQSRSVEAMLVNATVRAVEGDTLVLAIGAAALARRLSEPRNAEVVVGALHAVLGVRWQVRCEHGDGAPPARGGGATAPPPAVPARRPAPPRPPRRAAPEAGEPLPPEPPPEDAPPDDEEAMLAEAAAGPVGARVERRDPEEVAIELLGSELGARMIDRG